MHMLLAFFFSFCFMHFFFVFVCWFWLVIHIALQIHTYQFVIKKSDLLKSIEMQKKKHIEPDFFTSQTFVFMFWDLKHFFAII